MSILRHLAQEIRFDFLITSVWFAKIYISVCIQVKELKNLETKIGPYLSMVLNGRNGRTDTILNVQKFCGSQFLFCTMYTKQGYIEKQESTYVRKISRLYQSTSSTTQTTAGN